MQRLRASRPQQQQQARATSWHPVSGSRLIVPRAATLEKQVSVFWRAREFSAGEKGKGEQAIVFALPRLLSCFAPPPPRSMPPARDARPILTSAISAPA
jgi:hypothetical protein